MKRLLALLSALLLSLTLASCSNGKNIETSESASTSENLGSVTVFAAASLRDALQELNEEVFLKEHPGTEVTFNFDGSQNLVSGINQGQPADILLTADQKNMTKAIENGDIESDVSYATNTMVMVTPADNPADVKEFTTGGLAGKKLVICALDVPCGNATKKLAEQNGVELNPVSEEQNVKDVQAKITAGEGDVGLIYKTDAMNAGDKVQVIEIPGADKVVNDYRIAVVKNASNKEGAQAFMDAVLSDAGQRILAKYGFTPPTSN